MTIKQQSKFQELVEICTERNLSFTLGWDCGYFQRWNGNEWQEHWGTAGFSISVNGYGLLDSDNNEVLYPDQDTAIETGIKLAKMQPPAERKQ